MTGRAWKGISAFWVGFLLNDTMTSLLDLPARHQPDPVFVAIDVVLLIFAVACWARRMGKLEAE